jgi:hypothetical protein
MRSIDERVKRIPEFYSGSIKSVWHAAIATVGVYEYRKAHSLLARVLSIGLILFHMDAAFCDAVGKPTTLQRLLANVIKKKYTSFS